MSGSKQEKRRKMLKALRTQACFRFGKEESWYLDNDMQSI